MEKDINYLDNEKTVTEIFNVISNLDGVFERPYKKRWLDFLEREKKRIEQLIDEQIEKEMREIVGIDLLTEEQRKEALEKSKENYLPAVVYINKITGEGLKISKTYYDLYIKPEINR